jgi:hypothetical protein
LYFSQADRQGTQVAQALIQKIKLASQPTPSSGVGNGNFVDLFTNLSSTLLNFF